MDRVKRFQYCIEELLTGHSKTVPSNGEVECQLIFDSQRHHYQLVDLGWDGQHRIYNCVMHLDIKDGKIWIQRNQTDESIVDELVSMGIDKTDIVLGLQPPDVRRLVEESGASVNGTSFMGEAESNLSEKIA